MDGIYTTDQAVRYVEEKSGGAISERAFIWYVRDKRGREKAAREGVLQAEKVGRDRVFTQTQLDEFITRYPAISVRGRKTGWRKERNNS